MTTRIDLIRHAQSQMNLDRTLVGGRSNPTPLSDEGRRTATELGHELARAGWHPDALYCTSAIRSRDTALLLAHAAGWPEPQVHGGLLELSQGSAEGGQRSQWWTPEVLEAMHRDPLHHRLAPDGENHAEVQQRMTDALHDLARRHPGGHVVAVSHGVAMRTLQWALTGGDHEHGFRRRDLPNLGILRFAVTDGHLVLVR